MAATSNKKERARDAKKFLQRISNSKVVDGILFDSLPRSQLESATQNIPRIFVEPGDTLTVAKTFDATCILSMASPSNRGGGFLKGAIAQEEYLCARTNLYLTLRKFDCIRLPDKGGIYSPEVRILRDCDLKFISETTLSVISCAAINRPDTTQENRLSEADAKLTVEKMKFILRCADQFEHKTIVLGALGCGAFQNPPAHVAELWKIAILGSKTEIKKNNVEKWNHLSDFVFAIKDKPGENNYHAFKNILLGLE